MQIGGLAAQTWAVVHHLGGHLHRAVVEKNHSGVSLKRGWQHNTPPGNLRGTLPAGPWAAETPSRPLGARLGGGERGGGVGCSRPPQGGQGEAPRPRALRPPTPVTGLSGHRLRNATVSDSGRDV